MLETSALFFFLRWKLEPYQLVMLEYVVSPWLKLFRDATNTKILTNSNVNRNKNLQWHLHRVAIRPLKSGANRNLEMLVFEERGKPEYPEKNLTEQREPTTTSAHILRRVRKSIPSHIGGRRLLSPPHHTCSLIIHNVSLSLKRNIS